MVSMDEVLLGRPSMTILLLTARLSRQILREYLNYMKKFIVLLLSCVSVAAADTGVRMFTSMSKDTATPGGIVATETYTRDGEQDLIRIT